jgi:hypothetical protein
MGNQATCLVQSAGKGTIVSGPSATRRAGGGTGDCVALGGKSFMESTITGGVIPGRPTKSAATDRQRASARSFSMARTHRKLNGQRPKVR